MLTEDDEKKDAYMFFQNLIFEINPLKPTEVCLLISCFSGLPHKTFIIKEVSHIFKNSSL